MKRKALIVAVLFMLLFGACAPQAAPTASAVDIQHTAEAAAFTMVAQTQELMPTDTAEPPTETPSSTPAPTETLLPSVTIDPLLPTATFTAFPTTVAQQPTDSSQNNCNKPLTAWKAPTANFSIVNETKPEGKIVLSLYAVTEFGECGYLNDLSQGPVGVYSAGAFVDGKQSFKVFGGFRITEGSWKIIVRNDAITAAGGCYPHC
jgi:hypothetical protein